jgi:hypothetical protein
VPTAKKKCHATQQEEVAGCKPEVLWLGTNAFHRQQVQTPQMIAPPAQPKQFNHDILPQQCLPHHN